MMRNEMKAALAAGRPALGVQIDTPWPELVEVCGHLGFDWVFLDAEHGTLAEADVAHLARAADAAGITPVVRVPRNVRGVANLDEILAVDGIDVVFVGPADLSASMGGPIGFDGPEVRRTVDGVLRRTIAAGKVAGVNTGGTGECAPAYVQAGVPCLVTGAWGLIGAGARSYLGSARVV